MNHMPVAYLAKPLHEIAQELRSELDKILPADIEVTINTREEANGTGSITLTISGWSKLRTMNNEKRILATRIALLDGRDLENINLSSYPLLSSAADQIVQKLQNLVDRHCPPRTNAVTNLEEWPVVGYVEFNPRTLSQERNEIMQSLKGWPAT